MADSLLADERRVAQIRKLTEVSRALTYAVSLDEVLRLTVERAAELLDTDKAVLMLTNADGVLSVRAATGLDKETTDKFREPLDETLIRRLQGLLGVDSQRFLGVPLVASGEVTGILAVAFSQVAERGEEHEWLLSALADQASVALEKTRLDEAAKYRERIIGIVSHDLRNPLNAILLGTQMLLRNEELDARTIKTAARIQSSAERATRLIRDLLDYTQAHLGGGIPVERSPGNLGAIVRHALEELQAMHPLRRIVLSPHRDIPGMWDVDRLTQVVGNLVSNALVYSPPSTDVAIDVQQEEGWAIVTVQNFGSPIPPAQMARIFEPMQRAGDAIDNASRSVGLGLYIVRHLVEAHGGSVSVHSTEAEGTRFTVRLPSTSQQSDPR